MFQDRIKLLRESHGLTKKEIAKAIEISERAYITYEYGQREPSMETIIKLAKYYNVTTDYLLDQETIQPLDQFENLKFTKEMEKKANED
ncbi:MAG: helix-turn-helix domain-containing protein, partial [Oscillospiraceae bacterium]|nr:helix-turn-helix domain-containing protein [Oscillospiraceae bacterium]